MSPSPRKPSDKIKNTSLIMLSLLSLLATHILPALVSPAIAGTQTISLIDNKGNRLPIGTMTTTPSDAGDKFKIAMDETKFTDHFLNMKPFKCISGEQMLCHLIYPYKTRGLITKDSMMDLEYALLFLHKSPGEYGINFWNGVYYRLSKQPDGAITGILMETDMNVLASPPATEYGRPIGGEDLIVGPPKDHRFPTIEIK